jgi:hypothetical protein
MMRSVHNEFAEEIPGSSTMGSSQRRRSSNIVASSDAEGKKD